MSINFENNVADEFFFLSHYNIILTNVHIINITINF